MLKNNENGVAWKSGKSGDFGERLGNDPRRGRRKIGEGGRWKEGGGGARYSMKLEAVCYIQRVRIFSLLANVTN